MVKVIVTPVAIEDAKAIFSYFDACTSRSFSKRLLKEFVAYARCLEQMPEMGAVEPLLVHLGKNYRYVLVFRRYKLIYCFENEICSILMVCDCRQDPKQLKNSDRFKSSNRKSKI